jgi:hypothetical protein
MDGERSRRAGTEVPIVQRDYLVWAMHDTGRIELRHNDSSRWHCGLFDDLFRLRQQIDLLSGSGNLYTTINAPKIIPSANDLGKSALCDDDIAFVVRLPIDFDPVRPKGVPSTDDELREAISARDRFITAMAALGWPLPATGMSGNGAHALYRCRMRATPATEATLRALYRGWRKEFSSDVTQFDSTVSNASRVWRLYGTINRKGEATDQRPYRVSSILIPARWDALAPDQIETLASAYLDRERQEVPRSVPRSSPPRRSSAPLGSGDYTTLDVVGWFEAHGAHKRQIGARKHAVTCPWVTDHSTVDDQHGTDCVIWESDGGLWPRFHCSHAHCVDRTLRDVLAIWTDADAYCSATWQRRRP